MSLYARIVVCSAVSAISAGFADPAPELEEKGFAGVVRLSTGSGTLVRFTSSEPKDRALLLTCGHCLEQGFLDAGEVITARPEERIVYLQSPDGRHEAELHSRLLLYATMTDTDIALYDLAETFEEIARDHGINPLSLARESPRVDLPVHMATGINHEKFSCAIAASVPGLQESMWLWKGSFRLTAPCKPNPGGSGSSIVDDSTGEVVAVLNTVNEPAGGECKLNAPCEIDSDGHVSVVSGAAYAQRSAELYGCLTDLRELDLSRPGCMLPH
jgi:hypothetical protein